MNGSRLSRRGFYADPQGYIVPVGYRLKQEHHTWWIVLVGKSGEERPTMLYSYSRDGARKELAQSPAYRHLREID